MTDKIIDSISTRLREVFGESYTVQTEMPQQGAPGPCFFIALTKSSQAQLRGKKCMRSNTIDIQYIPGDQAAFHAEADGVSDVLYENLGLLTVGGELIAGTEMNCKKEGMILHFYADYNVLLLEEEIPEVSMEELSVKAGIWK